MHDLRTVQIPVISDDKTLERLCRDLLGNDPANDPICLHGRKGQSQDGVDVYGREVSTGDWFGVQCKVRMPSNRLSEKEVREEIELARKFNPKLRNFSIWTTLPRDRQLQEIERSLINELATTGDFGFSIRFWEDLEEDLKAENNLNVYLNYYQSYFVDNTRLGQAVCNLMRVNLGIGKSTDSGYEIALGKIPKYKDNEASGIDYYRGTYLILNFSDMRMEVFNPTCHPSDLERAVPNRLDRIRICDWLNSIENLDELIYGDARSATHLMSEDEWKRYVDESREIDET